MRFVFDHIPADRLPSDLRPGISGDRFVRLIVETETSRTEEERRAAGQRLLKLTEEMGEEAQRRGMTEEILAEILGIDEEEKRNLFDD